MIGYGQAGQAPFGCDPENGLYIIATVRAAGMYMKIEFHSP